MPLRLFRNIAGLLAGAHLPARPAAIQIGIEPPTARFRAEAALHQMREHIAGVHDRLPRAADQPPATLLSYGAVAVMAAILMHELLVPAAPVDEPPVQIAGSPWIEWPRAHGAFSLDTPALAHQRSHYVVRRHRDGGGRIDSMTWGGADEDGPYVRLSIYRPGNESPPDNDPLEAVAQVAADSAIDAELIETRSALRTKFGALPVIDMKVIGADGQRTCVAAAGAWQQPPIALVGWWCNPGPELVARGELACLFDRIALLSAGGDTRLADFFAQVELRRNDCGAAGTLVNPTHKRADDWIAAKSGPKLRGRLAGR